MTQHQQILNYLNRYGSITPMEAFANLGITKLATRVSELKKAGYSFVQEMVYITDNSLCRKCYMRYSLEAEK